MDSFTLIIESKYADFSENPAITNQGIFHSAQPELLGKVLVRLKDLEFVGGYPAIIIYIAS